MPTNNAADTLNAPLTFNGSPFVVNSAVINIGNGSSAITISGSLNLPAIAAGTTSDVLYYNTGTNAITYGASGGGSFSPANNYTWTGNQQFNAGFGVNSNADLSIDTTGRISIGGSNATEVDIGNGANNINLNTPNVFMAELNNTTNTDILYIDPTTFLVSYGSFTPFSTSGTYTLTGSWQFDCPFGVSTASNITIEASSAFNLTLSSVGIGSLTAISGSIVTIGATSSSLTLNAATNFVNNVGQGAATNCHTFAATATSFFIISGGAASTVETTASTLTVSAATDLILTATTQIQMTSGVPTQTSVSATPTVSLPVGFAYLCIDSSGNVGQFS